MKDETTGDKRRAEWYFIDDADPEGHGHSSIVWHVYYL
jgi:hypothetical protein